MHPSVPTAAIKRSAGLLVLCLLFAACGNTVEYGLANGDPTGDEQWEDMPSTQPKSLERIKAGLKLLRHEVGLPKGSIEVFEQEDEHYWTLDEATRVSTFGPTPNSDRNLFSEVSKLAPITGLWPIDTSEWETPYPVFVRTADMPSPLEWVTRGLNRHNTYSTGPTLEIPARLATPGSGRLQNLPNMPFSLVQADSLVDLIRYVPTETFNNDTSTGHWTSMVERFEVQVVAGEWHFLSLFLHRPPTTMEDAEILRLELASTGADEYPTADELLQGGAFELHYS